MAVIKPEASWAALCRARGVMPGLVPGIHDFLSLAITKDVDGRAKPGHDGVKCGVMIVVMPRLPRDPRSASSSDAIRNCVLPAYTTSAGRQPQPSRRCRGR